MKLLFSKMSLICVIFIAFFCVGCGKDSDEDGDGQNSAMQTDKRSGLTKEQDKLNAELEKLRGVCKCYDDSRDERAVYELSRTVTDDPSNVGAIVDDVLSADDPNAVKFKILALGYSREEEGKAGLLRILMSDIDPRIKLIAAAAYGMSPNGKRMLLPLSEGGVFVWVGEVDSEEALQAIAVEWRNGSGGRLAGELYYQLLKASAPQSSVAVDALWDYVTDGENPVELVKDVSKYLKANPSFQSSLGFGSAERFAGRKHTLRGSKHTCRFFRQDPEFRFRVL